MHEQVQQASESLADVKLAKQVVEKRIEEVAGIIEPIHKNWKRADALCIVHVHWDMFVGDPAGFAEFQVDRETAMGCFSSWLKRKRMFAKQNSTCELCAKKCPS